MLSPAAGLQDSDALTEAVREMGQAYPGLSRALLDERDLYMVWMLRRLASQCVPALRLTHALPHTARLCAHGCVHCMAAGC